MPQMKHNNQHHNSNLNESLMEDDLKWLVDDSVLIDMHKTKLGANKDYIVLAIIVNDRTPAHDLASFIENSVYDFEDVEVSSATDTKGRYLIYVELDRGPEAFNTINGILNDTKKLTGIEEWKFKGMDMNTSVPFSEETFAEHIITSPVEYDQLHPEVEEEPTEEPSPEAEKSEEEMQQEAVRESIKNRLKFLMSY
jgi:hypothetical protein